MGVGIVGGRGWKVRGMLRRGMQARRGCLVRIGWGIWVIVVVLEYVMIRYRHREQDQRN